MVLTDKDNALAIGYCFPIITAILIVLRFWARSHRNAGYHLDDWLTIPSWLAVTAACASLLTGIYKNLFSETTNIFDLETDRHIIQVVNAIQISYVFAAFFVKLSILFFYRRIFRGQIFNICSWTLIVLTCLWGIYGLLADIFACGKHVRAAFEGPYTVCPRWAAKLQVASFFIGAFLDLFVLILPMPFVWKLQASFARRLGFIFIFLVGGLAFVASMINAVIQYKSDTAQQIDIMGVKTFFPQIIALFVSEWGIIEVGVALIACNLPSLAFLWSQNVPQFFSSAFQKTVVGMRYAFSRLVPSSKSKSEQVSSDSSGSPKPLVASQTPKVSEGNDTWRAKLRRVVDERLHMSRVMRSTMMATNATNTTTTQTTDTLAEGEEEEKWDHVEVMQYHGTQKVNGFHAV